MQQMDLILLYLSIAISAGTVVAGLWKYMIRPAIKFAKKMMLFVAKFDEYAGTLDMMSKEFRPNGGNSLRDLIERIEAQATLNDSKMGAIIAHLNIGYFEANVDGEITWASKKMCELTGLMPYEANGNGWVMGISDRDRDRVYAEWKEAIEQHRDFETKCKMGNSEIGYVNVRLRSFSIKNRKSSLMGYLGIVEILDKDLLKNSEQKNSGISGTMYSVKSTRE